MADSKDLTPIISDHFSTDIDLSYGMTKTANLQSILSAPHVATSERASHDSFHGTHSRSSRNDRKDYLPTLAESILSKAEELSFTQCTAVLKRLHEKFMPTQADY